MFVLIEHLEPIGALFHLGGDVADDVVINGPVSGHQNLCAKLDACNLAALVSVKFGLQVLAQLDVGEHLRHLVYGVHATFNFQLVEHHLLGLTGNRGLV